LQPPIVQVSALAPHAEQSAPPAPHAVTSGALLHTPSLQQPMQLVALQPEHC
jgi:hypothetical protein